MSPLPPIRLGLAGCGRLAEAGYVPALAGLPGVELVAVADPDEGRRAAVGTGLPGYRDAGELVAAERARRPRDRLAGRGPPHRRRGGRGRRPGALVEKPPAPDAAGAAALAALDPAPVIGFNRRFDVAALAARATVDPSAPVELDLVLRYRRTGWAPVTVHDDALLDLGPHLVDWARWISHREVASVERAELVRHPRRRGADPRGGRRPGPAGGERRPAPHRVDRGRARAGRSCRRTRSAAPSTG